MLNNILKKIAATAIGFLSGLVLGPFAAVGKWFSMNDEESEGHALGLNKKPSGQGEVLGIPFFFAGGFVYGPFRGAYLGFKEGLKEGLLKTIKDELFTYDPFYSDVFTPELARQIPEKDAPISYRTFRKAGLLSPVPDSSEQGQLLASATTPKHYGSSFTQPEKISVAKNSTKEKTSTPQPKI